MAKMDGNKLCVCVCFFYNQKSHTDMFTRNMIDYTHTVHARFAAACKLVFVVVVVLLLAHTLRFTQVTFIL